ncbi:MAG: prepilin-type N-terminal cleavage/methylation domain-containing protein [Magnetococcales bacterium]|nr:prepilin-type N-terminal cleavage/methylation domain-containing protein [Magnetococcales bacterium]NGZ27418.1 prepilin-type N-terminal cleavage/methylation domain-containing protein [Magnetococcales bacterium]
MLNREGLMANRRERGFSLIEMAIVLVIIGLIITAITVGRNTMRSAEMNRLYTSGVGPWVQAVYAYYAKTGTRLVCGSAADCRTALAAAGLVEGTGAGGTTLAIAYADSAGADQSITLASVANGATATTSTVTITDSAGSEGITAVQGYVNGTIAGSDLTFSLTQFSTGYQQNM